MENNSFAAQDALSAIRETRSTLADRLITPWWYHPVLGALVAQLVIVRGLVDDAFFTGSLLVLVFGSLGLARLYRHRTGVEAGAPFGRETWLPMAGLTVVIGGSMLFVMFADPAPVTTVVVALATWVGVVVFGLALDRSYRSAIRGQA